MSAIDLKKYRYDGERPFRAARFDTSDTGKYHTKQEALTLLQANMRRMAELQEKFYADNRASLLIVFQAMDSGGKDGAIKHVMSGLNPQGVQVANFKAPSSEELDHDYLWRIFRHLPARGNIGIFNRSHYEEVLVGRVHNLPFKQPYPERCLTDDIWEKRYRQIRDFEQYLYENGTTTIKFYLNISKEEQKNRFLKRIDDPAKHWKFSESDIKERAYWAKYMKAFEQAVNLTATKDSPWYVIPADKKWYARLLISQAIIHHLEEIDPAYPAVGADKLAALQAAREALTAGKKEES